MLVRGPAHPSELPDEAPSAAQFVSQQVVLPRASHWNDRRCRALNPPSILILGCALLLSSREPEFRPYSFREAMVIAASEVAAYRNNALPTMTARNARHALLCAAILAASIPLTDLSPRG
jgi:hypothetical protein